MTRSTEESGSGSESSSTSAVADPAEPLPRGQSKTPCPDPDRNQQLPTSLLGLLAALGELSRPLAEALRRRYKLPPQLFVHGGIDPSLLRPLVGLAYLLDSFAQALSRPLVFEQPFDIRGDPSRSFGHGHQREKIRPRMKPTRRETPIATGIGFFWANCCTW